jgi:AcrR family transcriptional regulator
MRITADAKQATRARILEVAQRLFQDKGFDDAKVRDIAAEVGMATGTLFNYFTSKEEVAVALAEAAIGDAEREFARKRREGASLREDLFLQVATQLRRLRPLRTFIQPVIETAFAAPVLSGDGRGGQRLPGEHLQAVAEILHTHRIDPERWSMTAPIYWALYVGVLTFWGRDKSPKQEDTLAMLDQAVNMFVTWLESNG